MKVSFFSYPASFQNIGGGEIVLLKLKEYLEKRGITIKLFDMWNDKIEDFDILHVFGTVKDCLGLMQVARSRKVKIATSPIFWSSYQRALFTHGSFREKSELFLRHAIKSICPRFPSARRKMMLTSDILLPNSEMEKRQLEKLFAIPASQIQVVYNAADKHFAKADPTLFRKKVGLDHFVLSAGRFEPRKNQLNLIRAIRNSDHTLVLVGNPVSGFEDYFRQCKSEAGPNVTFVERLPHESPLLASAYAASDLYILPAWFETPGLVALEAALAGTRLAVTTGGSTREYFGDRVEYFSPASPTQIASAIRRALSKPVTTHLKDHVLSRYTWEKVAQDTETAYRNLMA